MKLHRAATRKFKFATFPKIQSFLSKQQNCLNQRVLPLVAYVKTGCRNMD